MSCTKWILLGFTLMVIREINCKDADYDVEKIIKSVPARERFNFIRYYSAIGYELSSSMINESNVVGDNKQNNGQFEELDSLSKFSIGLYEWLIKNGEPKNAKANNVVSTRRFYSNIICFPNNQCVDIGDVGIHP